MGRLLVGTDDTDTSERLARYLQDVVGEGDTVYIINSLVGGSTTDDEAVVAGDEALDVLEDALVGQTTIERHQYVRGNEPVEDLLAAADEFDVDEYVVGIRKRSPVGKLVFGSTAQNLLLEADRTVRCVPMVSD